MYGTVALCRAKPGAFDEIRALMDEWQRDFGPKVEGFVAGYTYRLDRNEDELVLTVVFRDKASYMRNADNPEQDKWFSRLREHLAEDPQWLDGEIIE